MCMARQASAAQQPAVSSAQQPRGFLDAMIMAVTKGKHRLRGAGSSAVQGQTTAGVTGPSPSYTGG